MILLDSMKQYILLQRTEINPENVAAGFEKSLKRDFNSVKPYLPEKCDHVLDIGCGLGGIDLLIYQHYGKVNIHLFDKSERKDVFYGFNKEYCFYNDLAMAEDLLTINGIGINNIFTYEAGEASPFIRKYNLIISLISWGFHYPVTKYLTEVTQCMQGDSVLILDIRKGVGGETQLEKYFEDVKIIQEHRKYNRIKCTKKINHTANE
jgi:SAM-dependent methyltransferase